MAKLDFDNLEEADLETLSKYIQRAASVGMIEKDRAMLNMVRSAIGVDTYPDDEPPHEELLTGNTSKASQGMTTPGEGTATEVSGNDTSSLNTENAA